MSDAATLVAQLAAAGTPPELLAAVAKELFGAEADREAIAKRREKDRERQRKSRVVTECHVTERDITGTVVTPAPDKVSPQTPLQTNPTPSPPYNPPASQKRGTRLADDFEPPPDWIEWAMKKRGWSKAAATEECEVFARHWQSKPGREACKLDWPKTWQNWVINSRRSNKASTYDPERITV